MMIDEFWNIVDRVQRDSGGDTDRKFDLLGAELRKLTLEEVRSFDAHFTECLYRAYRWSLWAAAYIMGGGCSDDGFWDFRSMLISMGRETYERAIADPDSLAELDLEDGDEMQCEGYQYIAGQVEEALGGGDEVADRPPHPKEPLGKRWDEKTVGQFYPKLIKKYGHPG